MAENERSNPGKCGNRLRVGGPGRPKGSPNLTTAIRKQFDEGKITRDKYALALIKLAMKGNGTAIREINGRDEGPLRDALDVTTNGKDLGPQIVLVLPDNGRDDYPLGATTGAADEVPGNSC